MLGRTGLVRQLRDHGYQVTRVSTPTSLQGDSAPPVLAYLGPPPEQAPPPPGKLDGWAEAWSQPGGMVDLLCAEGGPLRACFLPDATACSERIRSDLDLCLEQNHPLLPESPADPVDPAVMGQISSCGFVGIAVDALVNDTVGDSGLCTTIKASMEAALSQQLSGG